MSNGPITTENELVGVLRKVLVDVSDVVSSPLRRLLMAYCQWCSGCILDRSSFL